MTSQILILDIQPKHLKELAEDLRAEDRHEIEAYGISVRRALHRTWKGSVVSKVITVDGKLAAFFGVGGVLLSDIGTPYLLTTPVCEAVSPLMFVRIYQKEVLKMLQIFPSLENFVISGYDRAMKLLANSGFTIGEPEALGENGAMYRKFSMKRKVP